MNEMEREGGSRPEVGQNERGEAVEEAKPTSVLAGCGSSGVRHDGALKFMVFNGDANWKLVN